MPDTAQRPERDGRDAARESPDAVRLVVRETVPAPRPRRPAARPRARALQPDRAQEAPRSRAAREPASDRPAARSFASLSPPAAPADSVLRARRVAVGVLVVLFASAAAFIVTASRGEAISNADTESFQQRLIGYDNDVRAQLARLGPPGSVGRARTRTRQAYAATAALAHQLRAYDGAAAARLRTATTAQLRYLDAVGSTLLNPRSPLTAQLSERAIAARRALAALDRPASPPRRG